MFATSLIVRKKRKWSYFGTQKWILGGGGGSFPI